MLCLYDKKISVLSKERKPEIYDFVRGKNACLITSYVSLMNKTLCKIFNLCNKCVRKNIYL